MVDLILTEYRNMVWVTIVKLIAMIYLLIFDDLLNKY